MSLALAVDFAVDPNPEDDYFIPSERLNVNAKTRSRGVGSFTDAPARGSMSGAPRASSEFLRCLSPFTKQPISDAANAFQPLLPAPPSSTLNSSTVLLLFPVTIVSSAPCPIKHAPIRVASTAAHRSHLHLRPAQPIARREKPEDSTLMERVPKLRKLVLRGDQHAGRLQESGNGMLSRILGSVSKTRRSFLPTLSTNEDHDDPSALESGKSTMTMAEGRGVWGSQTASDVLSRQSQSHPHYPARAGHLCPRPRPSRGATEPVPTTVGLVERAHAVWGAREAETTEKKLDDGTTLHMDSDRLRASNRSLGLAVEMRVISEIDAKDDNYRGTSAQWALEVEDDRRGGMRSICRGRAVGGGVARTSAAHGQALNLYATDVRTAEGETWSGRRTHHVAGTGVYPILLVVPSPSSSSHPRCRRSSIHQTVPVRDRRRSTPHTNIIRTRVP
ncbi:hypothetical protein C8R45DRAFT_1157865 [Mycena sanguinolenta]|nr:hypothetical protein C8R45DRAFT_1157865 [Mycena sanguinolenta]